ncbi:MAG: helix-turn-helix transcriptional regulator [Clostridiales bacterium]|nr:helix-turn-helix transcriptional regulator [Clostridiales bacterium]
MENERRKREVDQKIVDRLVELRKRHSLSQEEVAEVLGISRQAVSKWERGESSPDTENLIGLANLYQLTIDALLYGNGDRAIQKIEEEESKEKSGSQEKNGWDESDRNTKAERNIAYEEGSGKTQKTEEEEGKKEEREESFYQSTRWEELQAQKEEQKRRKGLSYPILVTVIYLALGVGWGLWHPSWMIFLTIPLHGFRKEGESWRIYLASPVMITIMYLLLGFYFNLWHVAWVLFFCIPLFRRYVD